MKDILGALGCVALVVLAIPFILWLVRQDFAFANFIIIVICGIAVAWKISH